jgi:hypothetical protein
LLLGNGECEPELTPRIEAILVDAEMLERDAKALDYLGGEQMGHFLACIAAGRGRCISIKLEFWNQDRYEPGERCLIRVVFRHGEWEDKDEILKI